MKNEKLKMKLENLQTNIVKKSEKIITIIKARAIKQTCNKFLIFTL